MKCREFMEAAGLLTPAQLMRMRAEEQPLAAHARQCAACGSWLESHRLLGNALGALQVATAQREASAAVEAAVMQAFRTQGFAPKVVTMPERPAPAMFRLSRFFEVGAYVAVAAALIVGLFLGSRILRDRQAQSPAVQARATSAPQQTPAVTTSERKQDVDSTVVGKTTLPARARPAVLIEKATSAAKSSAETGASDQAGYVAVMLCDPLICSGDEQVIRMELPATVTTDASNTQPVLADVVIGDDGLVRAMRIVHE